MKLEDLKKKIEQEKRDHPCDHCQGKGYVQESKNKPVHTCWKCLKEGRLT